LAVPITVVGGSALLSTRKYTDKKENEIFFTYKEIQTGAVLKSYMTNGLLKYD
jgi:hypothetical protein